MEKFLYRFMLKTTFICILVHLAYKNLFNLPSIHNFQWIDTSDIDNDIRTVVTRNGYIFENHTVVTDDGYILELHRLHARHFTRRNNTPVVFFMHGSFQSSIGWLMPGAGRSLPYLLADNGYDVWLGNARGSRYARRHRWLDPDRQPREFFDFSWHEMGYYDVPNCIDFIRNATHVDKVHSVTHSQGSAALYVMLSERPEYNQKVRSSIALAPGVFITNGFQPTAAYLGLAPKLFEWLMDTIKLYELFPYSDWISLLSMTICPDQSHFQPICSFVLGITCGFNYNELNTTILMNVFSYGPAGASWKQIMHYAQVRSTDRFQKYDMGIKQNLEIYGQEKPLEYNLSKVQIPTAMFYSDNDWVIDEKDFLKLYATLPNVDYFHKQEGYSHMDFIIGKSNLKMYDIIEKYLKKH